MKETPREMIYHHAFMGVIGYQYIIKQKDIKTGIIASIAGLLAADMATGLIHMFFDRYSGKLPILRDEARLFQSHHKKPYLINETRISRALRNLIIMPAPLLFAWINQRFGAKSHIILFEIVLLYGVYLSDFVHGLAHDEHASPFVKWLQKHDIILDPRNHNMHHETLCCNYCTLNGLMNPLVNLFA